MSRTRLILLGLLAVVAVGGDRVGVGGGTAGECSGKVTSDAGLLRRGSRRRRVLGKSRRHERGEAILKATVASVTTEIKCETGKSKGTIEDGAAGTVGKSKATITFEGCKLVKPTNCKLTAADEKEIKTTELKGELELNAGRIEDKLEPKQAPLPGSASKAKNQSCVIAEVGKPKKFQCDRLAAV